MHRGNAVDDFFPAEHSHLAFPDGRHMPERFDRPLTQLVPVPGYNQGMAFVAG